MEIIFLSTLCLRLQRWLKIVYSLALKGSTMATNFKANSKNLSIITHKNYKIPQPDQQQKRLPQKPSFVIFRCHLRTSPLHQDSHKHCRPRHRSATQSPTYQRSQPHLHLFRTKLQFFALSLLASEENRYPGKYTYTLKPEKKTRKNVSSWVHWKKNQRATRVVCIVLTTRKTREEKEEEKISVSHNTFSRGRFFASLLLPGS